MKGEKDMCEHKRLKTRGHRVFRCQCGAELSIDFLMNQGKTAEHVQDPVQEHDQTISEETQPETEQPYPVPDVDDDGKQPEKAPDPVEQEPDDSKPAKKAEKPVKEKPGRKPTGKSTAKNKAAKIAD